MKIAVIGDYRTPEYKDFLSLCKMAKPEDTIMDLSRHQSENWSKNMNARFDDITECHLVLIHPDFKAFVDSLRDVTKAQERGRECLIYRDGQFLPFPEYAMDL